MTAESVSLIATVLNEEDSIEAWLETVSAQLRPPDEIIIVDAGSEDATPAILKALAERDSRVRFVVAPGLNIAQGRNRAIEEATGSIIAVTDAGVTLEPQWLRELTRGFDNGADVVSGFFKPGGRNDFESVLAAVITPRVQEIDPVRFLPSSRSVALRREWWKRVGGYPTWLRACEDLVFDLRLKEAGARFAFAPNAIVAWYPRPTLRDFFKQYRFYARGDGHALLFGRRHAARYASYAAGVVVLTRGAERPWLLAFLTAGFATYMRKFVWRLWDERPFRHRSRMIAATALVPVIVVVGDIAKMVGYPQGRVERRRAGTPEALEHADIEPHRSLSVLGGAWREAIKST